jgi:hypothetical protein
VLPTLTPATDLGASGVAAYARRQGVTTGTFLEGRGPALTPERVGAAIVELAVDPGHASGGYQITNAGLSPVR